MSQTQQFSQPATDADNGLGAEAQAKAAEVAGQAQEKAQQAAGQVQDRLREQLDERSSQAAAQISEQASDLRSVGESLREQGKDGPARAADQLAQYAEKVGTYLGDKDSHALLDDAERFGRRQPWAVAAGGIALGFAASRLLKASSGRRYRNGLTVPQPAGVYATPRAAGENGASEWPATGPSGIGSGPAV
jgi:acyl-CoA reductase-like NAD-dependent aldehyde dehydrogenase